MYKKFLFALVLLFVPFRANALNLEVGTGYAQSVPQQDGTWRQEGLPNKTDLNSPMFMIGVNNDFTQNIRWHVDAVYLGSYSVNSWDTVQDSYYNTQTKQCVKDCNSLANFIGSGSIYGIAATVELHTYGPFQIGVQAGPFLYHSSWSVQVPNYFAAAGLPANTTPEQVKPWGWIPGGIQRSESSWNIGEMIGVSASYNGYTMTVAKYYDGKGWPMTYSSGFTDGWPPLWKNQTVIMVSKVFHF